MHVCDVWYVYVLCMGCMNVVFVLYGRVCGVRVVCVLVVCVCVCGVGGYVCMCVVSRLGPSLAAGCGRTKAP